MPLDPEFPPPSPGLHAARTRRGGSAPQPALGRFSLGLIRLRLRR